LPTSRDNGKTKLLCRFLKNRFYAAHTTFVTFESMAVKLFLKCNYVQVTPGLIPSPTAALIAKLGSLPKEILLVSTTYDLIICKLNSSHADVKTSPKLSSTHVRNHFFLLEV
jgi:hypothetical protein